MKQPKTPELRDKQVSAEFYDERHAEGYMDEHDALRKQQCLDVLRNLPIPDTGSVLDFGCGKGVLTALVKEALPRWDVYGTDLSSFAVNMARGSYPDCTFFSPGAQEFAGKKFDLLFTHHVLEHVWDLTDALIDIDGYLKPDCGVVHCMPCGNPGSFEHDFSLLIADGTEADQENRFFYEDVGHLRRATSDELRDACHAHGHVLAEAYYYNHYFGGLELFSRSWRFVLDVTNAARAVDADARRKLQRLRYYLLPIAVLRVTSNKFERAWKKQEKSLKKKERRIFADYALLAAGLIPYLFAKPVDRYWINKALKEWGEKKSDPKAAGMFLYFTRGRFPKP